MSIAMKIFNMPHQLTVSQVDAVRAQLLENLDSLKKNDSITIYISDINEIDTAGLQLLIALLKESQERSILLHFAGSVTAEMEIALLTGGFGREVPSDGQHMQLILQTLIGGVHAR